MKITILQENFGGRRCEGSHGLSYFIEYDNKKILFDAGSSDLYIRNAQKLGVDLHQTDYIVLSHGHWDHGNGLSVTESEEQLNGKKLITHPEVFRKRGRIHDGGLNGLKLTKADAAKRFVLTTTSTPYNITENIIYLGEIPRLLDFEPEPSIFFFDDGKNDVIPDDSALAIKTSKGLVVVSGCAHAGICNTVNYAKKISGLSQLYAIIGGFHLKEVDNRTLKTIEFFRNEAPKHIFPSHCTSFVVMAEFLKYFNIEPVKAGDIFRF